MNRINKVVVHTRPKFLKQYLFGLLMGLIFALSLPVYAMIEPEQAEPERELVPAIPRPDIVNPDIAQRVTRANLLIKELYQKQVNGEPLMEQSDRRNFRRILKEQQYPQSAILHTILYALFNHKFTDAHQAIQEAYGESVDFPDASDFTLKDLKAEWAQEALRAAVSHPDFNFLEFIPEFSQEWLSGHVRTGEERLARIAQEEFELKQAIAQSKREIEGELKHQEEIKARQEEELERAILLSQALEQERIRSAEQRAEHEAKMKAKKTTPVPGLSNRQKQAKKQELLSKQRELEGYIKAAQAEQADLMPPARLTEPEAYAWLSKLSDAQQNRASSIGDEIGRMEDDMVQLGYELEKLEYPDNVTQYRLVPQKNNDCGFRSARHAVLGYLHSTGKIDDKDFVNAIEVDEDAILSINDLKNLVKEDGTLMFPLRGNDYNTSDQDLQRIVNIAVRWPLLDTSAIDTRNISILPQILGLKKKGMQEYYFFDDPVIDAAISAAKQIRSQSDGVHVFILNADYSPWENMWKLTHWLPIIVEKKNGQYSYTILDSLNKGRLELVQDLMYLVEQHPIVE